MANIRSQIKRNRQNEKRRLRNRNYRGAARTAVKTAHAAVAGGADSQEAVLAAISSLDRAAQKGAIHPRNASRRKSRLMKRLHATGATAPVQAPAAPAKADKAMESEAAKKAAMKKAPAKKTAPKKTSTKK